MLDYKSHNKMINKILGEGKKTRLNEAKDQQKLIRALEKWGQIAELFKRINTKEINDLFYALKDAYIIGTFDKIDFMKHYSKGSRKPKSLQDVEDGKGFNSVEAMYEFLKACHAFYNTNSKDLANYANIVDSILDDAYAKHDMFKDSLGINWDKVHRKY